MVRSYAGSKLWKWVNRIYTESMLYGGKETFLSTPAALFENEKRTWRKHRLFLLSTSLPIRRGAEQGTVLLPPAERGVRLLRERRVSCPQKTKVLFYQTNDGRPLDKLKTHVRLLPTKLSLTLPPSNRQRWRIWGGTCMEEWESAARSMNGRMLDLHFSLPLDIFWFVTSLQNFNSMERKKYGVGG